MEVCLYGGVSVWRCVCMEVCLFKWRCVCMGNTLIDIPPIGCVYVGTYVRMHIYVT
jgi:hypothetical protein